MNERQVSQLREVSPNTVCAVVVIMLEHSVVELFVNQVLLSVVCAIVTRILNNLFKRNRYIYMLLVVMVPNAHVHVIVHLR